jgi:hypothetical protein
MCGSAGGEREGGRIWEFHATLRFQIMRAFSDGPRMLEGVILRTNAPPWSAPERNVGSFLTLPVPRSGRESNVGDEGFNVPMALPLQQPLLSSWLRTRFSSVFRKQYICAQRASMWQRQRMARKHDV